MVKVCIEEIEVKDYEGNPIGTGIYTVKRNIKDCKGEIVDIDEDKLRKIEKAIGEHKIAQELIKDILKREYMKYEEELKESTKELEETEKHVTIPIHMDKRMKEFSKFLYRKKY